MAIYSAPLYAFLGFLRLSESPGFLFVKFPDPGRSWNFLGYDVGGGHGDAGADAKICEN